MAQIQLSDGTRDRLRALKRGAETYDDVVQRLLSRPPETFQIRFQELDNDRPMSYEFVEVENADGESINIGEWVEDGDWRLFVVGEADE